MKQNPIFLLITAVLTVVFSSASFANPQPITNCTFAAFDIETTGLSPKNSRILEIGVIIFTNQKIIESKSWLINPGIPIHPRAIDVHGITDSEVSDKPEFSKIYPEFKALIKNHTLIAHNAKFDVGFIIESCKRNKLTPPENNILDTMKLSKIWFPKQKSYSLKAVADLLEIENSTYHRALNDAEYVKDIFLQGIKNLPADTTIDDLIPKQTK